MGCLILFKEWGKRSPLDLELLKDIIYYLLCTMVNHHEAAIWENLFLELFPSIKQANPSRSCWRNMLKDKLKLPSLKPTCSHLKNDVWNTTFQGCFNTPLEHTPKPLSTGYKGIPFIVG